MTNILDLDRQALHSFLNDRPYRADQVFSWVFGRQVGSFDDMTNIPKVLRERLKAEALIDYPEIADKQVSRDGTEKFAYRMADGSLIESVLIPDGEHWTICVSSQVGCAMGCRFCCTAQLGYVRNLTPGEILAQVLWPLRMYPERKIRNVVFMGMGEPMLNYENVLHAINVLTDPHGPDLSKRRITVSTCGIVPRINTLGQDTEVGLAVSLNAPDDETRSRIMPINRKYPLAELLQALREYELPNRRRITMEYVLLGGVNDSLEDARKLVRLLHGIKAKVNLIPFNPWPGCGFDAPTPEAVDAFEAFLRDSPLSVMRRREKGSDIQAACGQLAGGKKS